MAGQNTGDVCQHAGNICHSTQLNYLLEMYKMYIGHLSSVFNFFLIFSALVLNAIAVTVTQGLNQTSSLDEWLILFGIAASVIFFLLDMRTRQIVGTIEISIKEFEKTNFDSRFAYLGNIPEARLLGAGRHGVLFPSFFAMFAIFLFGMLIFL